MTDLVKFLRGRLDEDEAYARNAFGEHNDAGPDWHEPSSGLLDVGDGDHIVTSDSQVSRFMVRFDPARVLAEVEGKRSIIEACERIQAGIRDDYTADFFADAVLEHLATAYASHPEYDESWRP